MVTISTQGSCEVQTSPVARQFSLPACLLPFRYDELLACRFMWRVSILLRLLPMRIQVIGPLSFNRASFFTYIGAQYSTVVPQNPLGRGTVYFI